MVELRERKRPAPPPVLPTKRKATAKAKTKKEEEAPAAVMDAPVVEVKGAAPKVGDSITLEGFGGEVETHDEKKVTLAGIVAESKAGIILFTYPKASTPGCKYIGQMATLETCKC